MQAREFERAVLERAAQLAAECCPTISHVTAWAAGPVYWLSFTEYGRPVQLGCSRHHAAVLSQFLRHLAVPLRPRRRPTVYVVGPDPARPVAVAIRRRQS